MKTSDAGIELIKGFEAFAAKPYRDIVGILTWGYGHAQKAGDVIPAILTEQEACDLLENDLMRFELAVNGLNADLTQNEFDACVSLAFNIGTGAFAKSTVAKRLIAGDHDGAAEAILMWNKAGGRIVQGLVNRREKERALFLS